MKKVLVVDDAATVRMYHKKFLRVLVLRSRKL